MSRFRWLICLAVFSAAWGSTSWAQGAKPEDMGHQQPVRKVAVEVSQALDRLAKKPSTLSLQAALQAMARQYPERLVLETYGKSKQGRSLYRMRRLPWDRDLGRAKHGQPAVVIVADLEAPVDPASTLRWMTSLATKPVRQEDVELVFYPVPDPDGWVAGAGHDTAAQGICLERNFPVGWTPWKTGHGSPGCLPLSEPETKALAASLVAMPEAVGLVILGTGLKEGPHAALAGSLQSYAGEGLGLAVVRPGDESLAGWQKALEWVESQRPRLQVEVVSSKRLSQQLWLVECRVANAGQLQGGDVGSKVEIQVSGASCLKLAWSPDGESAFEVIPSGAIPAAPRPGQGLGVRLVLRVTDPGATTLHLDSPRLSGVRLSLIGGEGLADAVAD